MCRSLIISSHKSSSHLLDIPTVLWLIRRLADREGEQCLFQLIHCISKVRLHTLHVLFGDAEMESGVTLCLYEPLIKRVAAPTTNSKTWRYSANNKHTIYPCTSPQRMLANITTLINCFHTFSCLDSFIDSLTGKLEYKQIEICRQKCTLFRLTGPTSKASCTPKLPLGRVRLPLISTTQTA